MTSGCTFNDRKQKPKTADRKGKTQSIHIFFYDPYRQLLFSVCLSSFNEKVYIIKVKDYFLLYQTHSSSSFCLTYNTGSLLRARRMALSGGQKVTRPTFLVRSLFRDENPRDNPVQV